MKPICIGLVFVHTFAYPCRVLLGIRRCVEAKPQWLLTSIASNRQLQRILGRIRPDGVNTQGLVRTLSASRRPVVNVASVFGGLRFPHVAWITSRSAAWPPPISWSAACANSATSVAADRRGRSALF
jgi:hypothetical protein